MDEKIAILSQGLTKSYGEVHALRGVDLEVQRGEIFGFLGPNGAGKTTAIRCMLDLIRPDSGTLRVLGFDPQKDPVAVRAHTGYLPGELHLDDNMTVEGALRYYKKLRRNNVDWQYTASLAQRLDLDIKPQIKNLSKGNKQKVGVIQALMHCPDLLLLDEPTLGLDPLMQHEVLNLIREARSEGTTVFFSSHNMSEVQLIANRVGIIRKGVIAEISETSALIDRALRRVRIRFREPVDTQAVSALQGVTTIAQDDQRGLVLQVEGEMDRLIKTLAAYPVSDFETERPTLEEIFLAYYQGDNQNGG